MSINLEMWQTIFGLDIQVLSYTSRMIRDSLTFDNPGLFEATRISSQKHRDEVECCNLWLINQFMYILSENRFNSTFDDNLDLQKHILAAANLKQPWFFEIVIEKYMLLGRQLSSPDLQVPVSVTLFRKPDFNTQEISASVEYATINVQSLEDVERMLKFCVMILAHFISDLYIIKSPHLEGVINTVLGISRNGSPTIKLKCLQFFIKFFKVLDRLKPSTLQLFGQILHISGAILRIFLEPMPSLEDLQEVDSQLTKLFDMITKLPIESGTKCDGFLATALEFEAIKRRFTHNALEALSKKWHTVVNHIFENGYDFLTTREADEDALKLSLEKEQELWICGLYLRESYATQDALKESKLWNEIVRRSVVDGNVNFMSEFLNLILLLNGKFGGGLEVFNGDYQVVVNKFFELQLEQLKAEQNLPETLGNIQTVLSIKDVQYLDDKTQQQLFDVLIYGLEEVLELKFKPPPGVFQDFYDCQKELRDSETPLFIVELLSAINRDYLSRPTQNKLKLLVENIMKKSPHLVPNLVEKFLKTFPLFLQNKHINFDDKVTQFLQILSAKSDYDGLLVEIFPELICLAAGGQSQSNCSICSGREDRSVQRNGEAIVMELFRKFVQGDAERQVAIITAVPSLAKHYPEKFVHCVDLIVNVLNNATATVLLVLAENVQHIIPVLDKRRVLLDQTITALTKLIKQSLASTANHSLQSATLSVLRGFGLATEFELDTFLRFVKLTLFYMVREESKVTSHAMLVCEEICYSRKITPRNMFNWYKQSMLELIVPLVVVIFMQDGVGITHALIHVSKLFQYKGPQSFIYENHSLLLAHLLPYVIKYPVCEQILRDICEELQTDLASALRSSFLRIYQCLFLSEPDEIQQKCGDLIAEATGDSINDLLHLSYANEKSVPSKSANPLQKVQLLVYYHRNPQCVTNTIKCLLAKDGTECSLTEIVEYISSKFLGILTVFENNVIEQDNEKSIKRDVLLSLGEIIRLLGSKHITQFRFKIVSLLRTAVAVKEIDLHGICAQVWDIFLRTVDVPCLGSLLSTIVVSMEPLLKDHSREVNAILRYLIISNGNLLGSHLKDLFFIESLDVVDDVKQFIVQQNSANRKDVDKFQRLFFNYSNQINHDNLAVRIYGINYLTDLFKKNRSKINCLIMGQPIVDDQMESTLNLLIMSCKHHEEHLQVAAGICIGEIGAVEPRYLRQNYAPQKKFCSSILSTDFAISILAALCHAYQFQKNSKYVDSFSLAIQEILQYHCVDPRREQQMDIWVAIPERMRQIMEPLLTSCYTTISVKNNYDRHPVFPCRTCPDWAYIWASNIIENIENADVKRLLNSFKPSLKNDGEIMTTLMPYIILHGLQYSSEDQRAKIKEEFDLIFKIVATKQQQQPETPAENDRKEMPIFGYLPSDQVEDTENDTTEDVTEKCAKLAFNLLDFIGNWCHEYKQQHYKDLSSIDYKIVSQFHKSFDKKTLAVANFNCGEHARALQFVEDVVMTTPSQLQSELSFLGQIYAELLDSDSLEGAMRLKTINLTLSEQILLNNVSGKLNESAACYERMIQERDPGVHEMKDMVQCYLSLDQPETALLICEGLMEKLYAKHAKDIPTEISAEPLWRLGRFEEVEKAVNTFQLHENVNWGVRCGQVLNCLRQNNIEQFTKQTQRAREVILKSLRMTGIGENSYTKGYDQVLKLHLIAEIEKTFQLFEAMYKNNYELAPKQLDVYFGEMRERLELFRNQKNIQTILCLRRILYKELHGLLAKNCPYKDTFGRLSKAIDVEVGKSWITSTRVARKSGAVQQANLYILNCEEYRLKDLFLEKAKLLWEKGDQTNAFQTLNRGMEQLLKDSNELNFDKLPQEEKRVFAKAKFLLATYNAESMNIQSDLNVQYFKESLAANQESEICFVHYAQFLDKIYESVPASRKAERFELLREIMINYGNSMLYGFKFIYQSMPRMLSIWLDYTADKFSDSKLGANLTKIADGLSEKLPAFMYFTAFSQLVSRICHPSQDVYNVIKTILVKLVLSFPQQSLWMLLCVLKSSYSSREKRCAMVLGDRRLNVSGMPKLINDFNSLAVRLIDLTKADIKKGVSVTTVSALVRDLPRIISDHSFSPIIIPCEKFMQPILPSPLDKNKPVDAYVPFPQSMAFIQGIDEQVRVLQSLQKPRRVNFKASDGLSYSFLLKPKDDLRRDFRLMEFNNVVKHYLNLDLEARERRLNIRTYGVLPLNEEYGIIEWLDNLQTFRNILMTLYRQNKIGMAASELQPYFNDGQLPLHKAKDRFQNVFLKRHPPVFDQWFKMNFTTSHNWYMARTAYVRTCGVMSIVGYVLGLGDRHCENILFDVTNGDNVHVDFNCLFNAGEKFAIPERVPFRLTQNMVHAMGPLGVEGPFRKSCEVTLRLMRARQETLMSILRPFIYDPLVTWKKSVANDGNSERTDSDAMNNVQNIEDRLKGFVKIEKKVSNIPLSTEGQVNFVIKEAIDINNVAPMYLGWSPYL